MTRSKDILVQEKFDTRRCFSAKNVLTQEDILVQEV